MECVLGTLCAKAFIAKTDTPVNQPLNLRDFVTPTKVTASAATSSSSSPIAIGMLSIITGFERSRCTKLFTVVLTLKSPLPA